MAAQLIWPGRSTYIRVEIDFVSNWNVSPTYTYTGGGGTSTPTYTDVTADVRFEDGISWGRGRDAQWDNIAPGSFTFSLNNRAGTYDPATNANMVGSRLCRITMFYPTTGTAYIQFLGIIDSWDIVYPDYGKDQRVAASGTDFIAAIFLAKSSSVTINSTTAVGALQAVCSVARIPAIYQSFTTGTYTTATAQYTDTDCLSIMQGIANSQMQFLYVSKTGVVTTIPVASGTVTRTYDDSSGSSYRYSALTGAVGGSGAYTQVRSQQAPKVTQSIIPPPPPPPPPVTSWVPTGSTVNRDKFGIISLDLNHHPIVDASLQPLVNAWAGVVPDPSKYWFREMEVKPLTLPATLIPAVLGHELGDRISVLLHPLQGGTITKSVSIRTVRHEIKPDGWTVTFGLTFK